MKTKLATVTLLASALSGGTWMGFGQTVSGQPDQVISQPPNSSSTPSPTQQTTGGKITTAVENLLGRFLGHNGGDVQFNQLPQAVQNTVRGQAGTAPIQSVREVNSNGQTTYVVTFNQNGQNVDLQLDPSGRILNGSQPPGAYPSQAAQILSAAVPVSFYQAPSAVQSTLQRYTQGAPIQSLQKGTIQGQTIYQAAFQHNGQNVQLRVDQNGGLLRSPETDQFLTSIGMFPNGNISGQSPISSSAGSVYGASTPDWRSAPARQPMTDASMMDLNSLPPGVRNTFLSYAGPGAINHLERGMVNGQTVYEAEVEPNGQPIDLRVMESGALLNDQVNDRFLATFNNGRNPSLGVGRAATWQGGSASYSSPAPLINSTTVPFGQLPPAVQTTITAQANGMPIDRVTEGTLNGRPIYEVSYNQNGQWVNLRVADDGSVMNSSSNGSR